MQTKHQIQQLLSSPGISPNKRLGQHFLIDLNLMRLLVETAEVGRNDVVLEVGCGTGSLTETLAERAGSVVAVELDRNLAQIAKGRLAQFDNVELINGDVLESKNTVSADVLGTLIPAFEEYRGRFLLVANLPYNVASPLMMNLVMGPVQVDAMYVTVQKEVADRMVAVPGSADYGILSIFLAAAGETKLIRVLKPTVFWPRPQVDSAMVGFIRDPAKCARIADVELFRQIVHLFMSHRRKTVQSCCKLVESWRDALATIADWPGIIGRCGIDPNLRPEKLSPEDYVAIASEASKSQFLS